MTTKTILITGASSGIGKATAQHLASFQHRLILCGRNQQALEQLKSSLNCDSYLLNFDVRDAKAVEKSLQSLPSEWQNIDVLINNAGNAHGLEPLSEGSIADWDAMLDGNVKGLLYVSKAVLVFFKQKQSGHIINISSTAAKQTYSNGVVYCASKKAVESISEGMRLELTEFGIKVTNLAPGAVETNFSKIRFKGDESRANMVYQGYNALQAEDIADVIAYCIHAPKHVTIADITVYPAMQSAPTIIHKKQS